ncbi:MAG: LysM peptidoglycan-binding domain-containing protein, partial [Butyrivibrio sp.]
EVPFSEKADIPAASDDCVYSCRPGALQISTLLTGGGEINIKCVTSAEITVTERHEASIIYGVKAEKPDYEKIKALPGIVGYITREDDTLWDIAKKYCTTIKNIMDINELTGQEVAPGTKLMIIKSRV